MNERRSKFEIYRDVLYAIKILDTDNGAKSTHVMYASNMSWTPIKKVLGIMDERMLIEIIDNQGVGDTYKLTDKGEDILTNLNHVFDGFGIVRERPILVSTKRRDGIEIYRDIIYSIDHLDSESGNGAKSTHVMHASNMSWTPFVESLEHLIGLNLVEETDNDKLQPNYKLTDKGKETIKHFEKNNLSALRFLVLNDGRKKRGGTELYMDVLIAITKRAEYYRAILEGEDTLTNVYGAKPTNIKSETDIAYSPLRKILNSMIETGDVKEHIMEKNLDDRRTLKVYELSEAGKNKVSRHPSKR